MHLGLIGYGNIASTLLGLLEAEPVNHLTVLVRPDATDRANAALELVNGAGKANLVTTTSGIIAARPDLVVECAGQGAVADHVPACLEAGLDTVVVSVGSLAEPSLAERLEAAARAGQARLILPSGAIGGIDLLAALAPAGDLTVEYRGTKPPKAWAGTPAEDKVDLEKITAPVAFFEGDARSAAQTYPKNANVAATLALAGAGFENTCVALIADPDAAGNAHAYTVHSPLARVSVEIENAASAGNAKTSVATVYSVLREINRYRHTIVI